MLYLDDDNIGTLGINWQECIDAIYTTIQILAKKDVVQPIKPYLRYKNNQNRIIAMPAYVGGRIQSVGIKWIASFPENIKRGIPRAHSVVILNNIDNGVPETILNAPLLSIIRTASVTGMTIQKYDILRKKDSYTIGIIGFGPIGYHHALMCRDLLSDKVSKLMIYDIRDVSIPKDFQNIEIVKSWLNIIEESDIVVTCTVSEKPYINYAPRKGSLHINVSLRDYDVEMMQYFLGNIVVDDWDEVCRENTDIEKMALEKNLKKEDTVSLAEFILNEHICLRNRDEAIMINPMGMAIFDISMAQYYTKKARQQKIGLEL